MQTSETIGIKGIDLREEQYGASLKLPRHSHESAYFCYVVRGKFLEVSNGRSRLGRTATLFFHPPGEIHFNYFEVPTRCFDIRLDASWLERIAIPREKLGDQSDFRGGRVASLAGRIYSEFLAPDHASPLLIEGLTLEILAEFSRHSVEKARNIPPAWLGRVKERLHYEFGERFSFEDLARSAGVHPTHLAREFHRFYRCSMGDYVRERRIEFARERIAATDISLSEIALSAGFFDQSHFSRTFKIYTGFTPRQYRQRYRRR
jgi:AraC family transcriptional regulator